MLRLLHLVMKSEKSTMEQVCLLSEDLHQTVEERLKLLQTVAHQAYAEEMSGIIIFKMERMLSMRKILLFSMMVVFMTTFFVNKTFAQYGNEQEIEWVNYAIDITTATKENYPEGFYLCHIQRAAEGSGTELGYTYDFVTAGGLYGTHAVLGNRGMLFYVELDNGNYKFKSVMQNPNPDNGQYLGSGSNNGLFLDQNGTFEVTPTDAIGTVKDHPIYSIAGMGVSGDQLVTSNSAYWLIIPRKSFRDVLLGVTGQTNIEVSGLFNNTRFQRHIPVSYSWQWYDYDNGSVGGPIQEESFKSETNWNVWPEGQLLLSHSGIDSKGAYRGISPYIGNSGNYPNPSHSIWDGGSSYLADKGQYGGAEMRDPIVMRQTVDNLKPGTYVITAEAFVSNESDGGAKAITSSDPVAYLFASGTNGVSEGAIIQQLSQTEQTTFNDMISAHRDDYFAGRNIIEGYQPDYTEYFRRNVPASEFLAIPEIGTKYLVTVAVTVTESAVGKNDGTLTLGVAKVSREGRAYVDNVRVFYSGSNEFGLNAYSTKNGKMTSANLGGIDENKYEFNRRFNLSRDFGEVSGTTVTDPKWEALVMPVNLTKTQVLATFGDNAELCELEGLINDGYRIQFNPVALKEGSGNDIAIYAGECYAVKVTDAPSVARNEPYQFNVYSKDAGINGIIKYSGPIYQFEGVTRANTLTDLLTGEEETPKYEAGKVTKTYKTGMGGGHDLLFTGYFYRPESVPALSYVLSAGKVYYLNSTWNGLIGTMWTLQEVDALGNVVKSKNVSVNFGGGQTNGIENIESEDAPAASATGVYNLNGQKVSDNSSIDNLPKGIYIVNGRKMVVR